MIIQVRGTSGSGKSTVMRKMMNMIEDWQEERTASEVIRVGAGAPTHYRNGGTVVLGSYNNECGGCDRLLKPEGGSAAVADIYRILPIIPYTHLVCEGLMLSEDVKWTVQMPDVRVVFLNTPLATCLRQIESRRLRAGNDKPLNPTNTTRRYDVVLRAKARLIAAGVRCVTAFPNHAPTLILNWLRGG